MLRNQIVKVFLLSLIIFTSSDVNNDEIVLTAGILFSWTNTNAISAWLIMNSTALAPDIGKKKKPLLSLHAKVNISEHKARNKRKHTKSVVQRNISYRLANTSLQKNKHSWINDGKVASSVEHRTKSHKREQCSILKNLPISSASYTIPFYHTINSWINQTVPQNKNHKHTPLNLTILLTNQGLNTNYNYTLPPWRGPIRGNCFHIYHNVHPENTTFQFIQQTSKQFADTWLKRCLQDWHQGF